MRTIEIVAHCYAAEHPHFAHALWYQLCSLVLHPPKKCNVQIAVCMVDASGDPLTTRVLNWFQLPVKMRWMYMTYNQLGRRSIGRNRMAKTTEADLVWFADADYFFHAGCLDALADLQWPDDVSMAYPRMVKISKDHITGDATLERACNATTMLDINPTEYVDKRYTKAIGGAQIVRGAFARQYGYLDGDAKWQRPSTTMLPDTNDDMAYRRFCNEHGRIIGIDLPGVYRIRHSVSSYRGKP